MTPFSLALVLLKIVIFHYAAYLQATQAIELDTLIPLQYGTTKLILVGDPEQLPAVVISQVLCSAPDKKE